MKVQHPFTYLCAIIFCAVVSRGILFNSSVSLEIKIGAVVVSIAFMFFVIYCQAYLEELDQQAGMKFGS